MDHAARRAALVARLDDLGAEAFLVTRLPNVRYLTGFSGSNGQLVAGRTRSVLLTDGRYAAATRREVPDVEAAIYAGEIPGAVAETCRALGVRRVAFETDGVSFRTWSALGEQGLHLVPATGEVERLRRVKDEQEIERISQAQAIADDAFEAVTGKLAEGVTERQAAYELDSCVRQRTSEGVAFDTIVAFGESAAEPHHHPTDRPLSRGDVVKIDFGAVVDGYHSDMTRTVAFGEPSGRLRAVHDVVRRAQQAGVDAASAGMTAGALDAVVRSIVAEAGFGESFTHPLGHAVGLEIHEEPFLRAGSDEVLPANAVVTIEPGVYLPGVGGVRIEDTVVLGTNGCRVLARTPKDLIVL
jgi:Xaa-Pro aminopeptidase